MTTMKGRGIGRGLFDSRNAQVLRRPSESGIIQRFGNLTASETASFENEMNETFQSLLKLDFKGTVNLDPLAEKIKSLCTSHEEVTQCIDILYKTATKSKWNAHVCAIFCNAIGDVSVNETKLRTQLLRKLQANYIDRNKKYMELDSFLMDAVFLFEVNHHVRISGVSLKVLARPVIDYFGMLVDGASQKEIEVFIDQFPKCYSSLKVNDAEGLDTLMCKLRKQIICESSNVVTRAMMVEIFERILTDFEPLSDNARVLYVSLSKPIVKICE